MIPVASVHAEFLAKLSFAGQLLEQGKVEDARALAAAVLKDATDIQSTSLQGQALLSLAQYDRVLGRFRRAIEASQRAVLLFRYDGDIAAEAAALSLLAHASSILGRDAEAVEAALLSVRLGEMLPAGPGQVRLLNYLGVAYLWSQSFTNAEAALRASERIALASTSTEADALLPRSNLAWLEVMRLAKERYFTGTLSATSVLRERLAACAPLLDAGDPFHALPGVRSVLQRFAKSSLALCECWDGNLAAAEEHACAAEDNSQPARYAQVANVISHWVQAELNWARHDLTSASRDAAVLIELADAAEFEQMAYVGHRLMIQLCKAQNQHAEALSEELRYRRRELRVRAEILDSRHGVVQTHLDMRTSDGQLQRMAQHSKELERMSFEDSLTGIANRRHFDMRLAQVLKGRSDDASLVCVALIDVDKFKSVNDFYSHAAGDDILKAVAEALRESVREQDIPARIGGDEFAVLFPGTSLDVAQMVCHRIRTRVSELRWPQWSSDLAISVSIGVEQGLREDTSESLLRRSDRAMFADKTIRAQHAA